MDITEDQTSPDQLREAFRGIATDKVRSPFYSSPLDAQQTFIDAAFAQPFVTELDLRIAHLPARAIDYLREVIPSKLSETGDPEYDYERWLDDVFT